MGTDIHGVFQRRTDDNGKWEDIDHNYTEDRHYYLFAILAGVRNGYGFAGVPIFTPLEPIAEPRDYPDDFQVDEDVHTLATMEHMDPRRRGYYERSPVEPGEDENPLEYWMGDHSHSWLLGSEILAYGEKLKDTFMEETGVMSFLEFDAWDGKSRPDSYAGGVFGATEVTPAELAAARGQNQVLDPDKTYVRVKWTVPALDGVSYFFEEVARLVAEHGEVRFVFGFDS